jgi:hypothetical protein
MLFIATRNSIASLPPELQCRFQERILPRRLAHTASSRQPHKMMGASDNDVLLNDVRLNVAQKHREIEREGLLVW